MPETVSAAYRPREGTAVPEIAAPLCWGTLALDDLEPASVTIWDGPTGASRYWPELFTFVHPNLTTTDAGFNRVDAVWAPRRDVRLSIIVGVFGASVSALSDAVKTIRESSGLPAADVAAMIGVRRRQLYNLLGGGSASSERERWIGTLAEQISALREAASGEGRRVRAALLLPGEGGRSFYDLACERDEDALRRLSAELAGDLRAGRISGHVQRPSPTLRGRGSSKAVHDSLTGHHDQGEQD